MELIALFSFILLAIAGALHSRRKKQERIESFQNIAEKMGLAFLENDCVTLEQYNNSVMLNLGHWRVDNSIKGSHEGVEVTIADSSCSNNRGKTYLQTLYIISDPQLSIPHFIIKCEDEAFRTLGKMQGKHYISFDEDIDFSDSFSLQGKCENATRKFFNDRLRKVFMKHKEPCLVIEGQGNTLIYHKQNITKVPDIPQQLKKCFDFYYLFKDTQSDL